MVNLLMPVMVMQIVVCGDVHVNEDEYVDVHDVRARETRARTWRGCFH